MQLEISKESITNANITVIDGSALLWTIRWPLDGTVEDFVNAFENRIASYLVNSDVYLIFDRYHEYSIKSAARESRMTDAFTMHHMSLTTKLPSQKTVLSSVVNKKKAY